MKALPDLPSQGNVRLQLAQRKYKFNHRRVVNRLGLFFDGSKEDTLSSTAGKCSVLASDPCQSPSSLLSFSLGAVSEPFRLRHSSRLRKQKAATRALRYLHNPVHGEKTIDVTNRDLNAHDMYLISMTCATSKATAIDATGSFLTKEALAVLLNTVQTTCSLVDVSLRHTYIVGTVNQAAAAPTPIRYFTELQARLQHNIDENQRLAAAQEKKDTVERELRKRGEVLSQVLDVIDAEQQHRAQLQVDCRDAACQHYVQCVEGAERIGRMQRKLLRRMERARHVHTLSEREDGHRHRVKSRWINYYAPLADKLESKLRRCMENDATSIMVHMLNIAAEEKLDAWRREKARLEQEKESRLQLESMESTKRKELEKVYEQRCVAILGSERVARAVAQHKVAQKTELLNAEESSRSLVSLEEFEAWTWVLRRWDIAEQQRVHELEKARQVIMHDEAGVRDVIVIEEQIIRPILQDLIRTCTGMAQAKEIFALAAGDRRTLLERPPLLYVRVPDASKPDRYILKQHVANAPCQPPRVAFERRARVISELPVDWITKVGELQEQEVAERNRREEEFDKQKKLHKETQEKLGELQNSEHVQRMIQESLLTFSTSGISERSYIDSVLVKKRKEQILGGTITFTCITCKDLLPMVYKEELLSASDESLLKPTNVVPLSKVTRRATCAGANLVLTGNERSLVLHVPRYSSVEQVQEMLLSCRYSTTLGSATVPLHRPIGVTLRLYYIDAKNEDDPYLAVDHAEELPQCILEVETSGYLSLVLTPPYLFVPPDTAFLRFTEGDNIDKCAFLSDVIVNDQPIINRLGGVVTVASGNGTNMVSFEGGRVLIEFVSGYTPDDVVVFKSGSDAYFSDIDQVVRVKEEPVMKVVSGVLCRSGVTTTGIKDPCNRLVLSIVSSATSETVKRVLQRLRYYNVSQDPVEGPRQLLVVLEDENGTCSRIRITIHVEATDNPSTLHIPVGKKYFHFAASAAGIPAHLRQHIIARSFMVFEDAAVTDVDTNKFCGGNFACHVSANYQKGDQVGVHEECFLHEGYKGVRFEKYLRQDEHTEENEVYANLWCVYYKENAIGLAGFYTQGSDRKASNKWQDKMARSGRSDRMSLHNIAILTQKVMKVKEKVECRMQDMLKAQPLEGRSGRKLFMLFDLKGEASIEAVQAVTRAVTFVPVNKVGDYVRTMDLEIQIGMTAGKRDTQGNVKLLDPSLIDSSAFQDPLRGSLQIKVTPPLIAVSGKAALLKYTEGSGAVRVAPFELAPDTATDGYEGGFLSIEMIEGLCDDDLFGIKEDSTGILVKVRETLETDHLPTLIACGDKYEEDKTGKKVRAQGDDDEARDLYKASSTSSLWSATGGTLSEVYCEGKFLGILASMRSVLHITFLRPPKLEKERLVGKKEVTALARAFTYTNVSKDPQQLNKVVRVTLSDGSPVLSQAIIEIQVIPVDDVTDIHLRHERLRYRPCCSDARLPFLIAPLGEAHIDDPDTMYFDGGFISAELIAGPSKGDYISLLTLEQQKEQIKTLDDKNKRKKPRPRSAPMPSDDPTKYLFDIRDAEKKIAALDGSFTAYLSHPQTKNCRDANDIKITFPRGDMPVITREVLSFLLNCITFGSVMKEKLKEGPRTILVKVCDGVNPQDGRAKIIIDVRLPFLFQPSSAPMAITPGGVANLAPKLIVNHADTLGFIAGGYVQVEVVQGFAEGDELVMNLKEGGFTLKESAVYQKGQNIAAMSISSPQKLRFDFTPASKATQRSVTALLKTVGMKFPQSLVPCTRVAVFTGTYDRLDRVNEAHVTLTPPLNYKP